MGCCQCTHQPEENGKEYIVSIDAKQSAADPSFLHSFASSGSNHGGTTNREPTPQAAATATAEIATVEIRTPERSPRQSLKVIKQASYLNKFYFA